jgi:hypothetical protein
MLTKEQIGEELKMAYVELRLKEDMLNYADEDFIEAISYEIKAIESKIKALKRRYNEVPQETASEYWTKFVFDIVGIKKDTAVAKHDSI